MILASAALAMAIAASDPQTPPPQPCASAEHHAFDFWIGRWSVTETRTGKPAGDSLVERLYGGCVLRENWSEPGFAGGSLNIFSVSDHQWHQTWADQSGALREFAGGMEQGRMVLVARTRGRTDPNKTVLVRMSFTPGADGSVRQYSDFSTDDGATWAERYDYTYRPAGSAR